MVNAIGTAALALLMYDPRQILTPSFQMTFLCVLIVGAIAVPILERTSLRYSQALKNWDSSSYAAQLPPKVAQFRVELQMIAGRVASFVGEPWSRRIVCTAISWSFAIWELIFLSAVMQMGLALPMAYYFHRAPTLGLPANLLVVPLTQLLMPAAIAALALGAVWVWLAKIPVLLTTLALHGIMGTVRGLGDMQMADLRVAVPSVVVMLLAGAALGLAMWGARRHSAITCIGLGAILGASVVLAVMALSPKFRPGVLELTSIDVGEGDSSLLISPQGKTLLIDAGGPIGATVSQFDFGEDVVSPYLWSRGISRLHAVAVTHAHSDHIGGISAVLRNFRPKELWAGLEPPSAMQRARHRAIAGNKSCPALGGRRVRFRGRARPSFVSRARRGDRRQSTQQRFHCSARELWRHVAAAGGRCGEDCGTVRYRPASAHRDGSEGWPPRKYQCDHCGVGELSAPGLCRDLGGSRELFRPAANGNSFKAGRSRRSCVPHRSGWGDHLLS